MSNDSERAGEVRWHCRHAEFSYTQPAAMFRSTSATDYCKTIVLNCSRTNSSGTKGAPRSSPSGALTAASAGRCVVLNSEHASTYDMAAWSLPAGQRTKMANQGVNGALRSRCAWRVGKSSKIHLQTHSVCCTLKIYPNVHYLSTPQFNIL